MIAFTEVAWSGNDDDSGIIQPPDIVVSEFDVGYLNEVIVDVGQGPRVRVQYPRNRILASVSGECDDAPAFDSVYGRVEPGALSGRRRPDYEEALRRFLKDDAEALGIAEVRGGLLEVRLQGGLDLLVDPKGIGDQAALDVAASVLVRNEPLGEAIFPAVRMRQWIGDGWVTLRRFGLDGFHGWVAPQDSVRLEIVVFPLVATFYGDHVCMMELPEDEWGHGAVAYSAGSVGATARVLEAVKGVKVEFGEPLELRLPHELFTSSLNVEIVNADRPAVRSALMFEQVAFWNGIAKAPVIYGPGPTFDRVTYRSALLNSACRSVPPEFPESDTEWPAWVLEYGEPFK